MDKVDGPYYFFKLIRRIRNAVPQWMPMPGVEGREINIVPVDFVVRAMDHIAHTEGLDGRAFHLTDPNPPTAGEVIDIFARAAHAPQSSVRLPAAAIEALEPLVKLGADARRRSRDAVARPGARRLRHPALGARSTSTTRPTSTRARPRRRSRAPGSRVPPLEAYAGKLWDYWERHLDPDLFRDRTLMGAARGRLGLVGGLAQILEQQIPDELMRLGRRLVRATSRSRPRCAGAIVMVTGASSGIGKSAALKIADAGGTVLLVARTPEKLERPATRSLPAAGSPTSTAATSPTSTTSTGWPRRCSPSTATSTSWSTTPGRSIRRSIALSYDRPHDFERTIQLNYLGAVRLILKLLPVMRERKSGQIINVSSIGVQTNMPRFSAYVASKSALDAFSRSIASEIIDDGVHITTINMPLVRTPMIAPTKMYDRFPTITPEEAADMICEAIIHKPKRIATPMGTLGQILYALNPKSIDYILNTAYHLFPDSSAAKGEKKTEARRRRRDRHDHRRAGQQPAGRCSRT